MPLSGKPECSKCGSCESSYWRVSGPEASEVICQDCIERPQLSAEAQLGNSCPQASASQRKSARVTRYAARPQSQLKNNLPRAKGRRHIFKKTPVKSPAVTATPVTSNYVFYKGSYFQIGDIVSMQDIDGGTYYAQIRGLLTDQYCEKSAAVTWLLPTTASPPPEDGFNPETYIIGPEEDLPRKLEYMEFVMHAPSDYYKLKNSPYPPILAEGGNGYVWTSLRNEAHIKR